MSNVYSYIANAIKEYCFFHGHTHADFAKLMGVSERTVSRWVTLAAKIPRAQLQRLEQILQVSLTDKLKQNALINSYKRFLDIDKLYNDYKNNQDAFFQKRLFNLIVILSYELFADVGFKVTLTYEDNNSANLTFDSAILKDAYISITNSNSEILCSYVHQERMVTNNISKELLILTITLLEEILCKSKSPTC